jgi:hypothetical protein
MLARLKGVLLTSLFCIAGGTALAQETGMREADYVGNVYGSVTDADTGRPIQGAQVILVDKPLRRALPLLKSRADGILTRSNKGDVLLPPEVETATWKVFTDEAGEFLMAGVATPFPYKAYTVIATAPGYDAAIVNYVPVLPGAIMELKVTFVLTKGKNRATLFEGSDSDAPIQYGHSHGLQTVPEAPPSEGNRQSSPGSLAITPTTSSLLSLSIYATQEGHIGHATANGHIIRAGDNFVALPSRRALCSLNGYEFQVQISYNSKTVTAPVWEVGPWNPTDDYWDPTVIRESWSDLSFGMPEAQAAYQNHYNGGRSSSDPVVTNPAGIDLASGTAGTLGFGASSSHWVNVSYLWTTGHADFSVSASSSAISVAAGASASIPVTFLSSDGFHAYVSPSFAGLPANSSAVFSSSSVEPPANGQVSTSLTVKTTPSTPLGTATLRISGTVGRSMKTTTVTLNVTPPPLSASSSCQPTSITLGASTTCSVTAMGGLAPYRFSVNGQSFGSPQASPQASASIRPSQSGAIVSIVRDSAGQQAQASSQVQVYRPMTVSCSASPNPVRINNTITWRAQATNGSGSFSYHWLNGTTTQSYSKSYPTAQTVSNWVVITDTTLNASQTAACSLTVTR